MAQMNMERGGDGDGGQSPSRRPKMDARTYTCTHLQLVHGREGVRPIAAYRQQPPALRLAQEQAHYYQGRATHTRGDV